jgi:hypothetical protein
LITPRLTSRAGGMNAFAIFVGILFWGWRRAPASKICGRWRSY